jgi:HAMP domain-containing protein
VAREVGTEGVLGGQAEVPNVAGTWKDLTDNVNFMAGNLTGQVRNIALVTTAVARGDLSQKITADVKGEMLELKNTINTMVDQLSSFASEVTRVAREVGTEGGSAGRPTSPASGHLEGPDRQRQLHGRQPHGPGAQHRRRDHRVARGDLSRKITVDVKGEMLELKNTINTMVDQLSGVRQRGDARGAGGGHGGRARRPGQRGGSRGTWKDLTDNVNFMAGNLTVQVRDIAR